jgi:hypothetical protein
MLLSRHQNAGQNHGLKAANGSFEKCVIFQIFGNDREESKFIL